MTYNRGTLTAGGRDGVREQATKKHTEKRKNIAALGPLKGPAQKEHAEVGSVIAIVKASAEDVDARARQVGALGRLRSLLLVLSRSPAR